ncbi:MAG: single-stranded DNA-binding protein [Sulfuricaulis sp.]
MSKDINNVILKGRLGNDPQYRVNPSSNKAIATASLYTKMVWKDGATSEKKESSERHNLVFFGKLADVARDVLRKGDQVFIVGRLQTRKWTDETTKLDRYTTEIIVNDLTNLGVHSGASVIQRATAPASAGSMKTIGDGEAEPIPF